MAPYLASTAAFCPHLSTHHLIEVFLHTVHTCCSPPLKREGLETNCGGVRGSVQRLMFLALIIGHLGKVAESIPEQNNHLPPLSPDPKVINLWSLTHLFSVMLLLSKVN